MTISYITHLQCTGCDSEFDYGKVHTFCPNCQSPLITRYNLDSARNHVDRNEIQQRGPGMWRWQELLPVEDPKYHVTLGEGDTPLLLLPQLGKSLGLNNLYVKDESNNPTGSFKARGLSAAVSKAKELGIKKLVIPTAGNAGGALAAYAARAGMDVNIFMPKDAPIANIEESRITGANVVLVDGLISDAAGMVGEKSSKEGWFDVSTFKEPYRMEGKKVMGYELAQFFNWELPEVIIYPTGGGTGLVGMWKAFAELEALGWLEKTKRPRMVAVQAEGCAPVIRAFEAHAEFCDFWINAETLASGLRVPKSFGDRLVLESIYKSDGTAVAVSDNAILEAQRELASKEGVFAAPEGAATLAALKELVRQKWVHPDERIVLFNTGSGLKYLDFK